MRYGLKITFNLLVNFKFIMTEKLQKRTMYCYAPLKLLNDFMKLSFIL